MKIHAWATLILTLLLGIVAGMFTISGINEAITHPQFGDIQPIENVIAEIKKDNDPPWYTFGVLWYVSFFIIDFIWAACLLTYLYRRVRNNSNWLSENPFKVKGLPRLLFISIVFAYVFDVWENISYLRFLHGSYSKQFSTIIDLKILAYALVFILVLIFVYEQYVFHNLHKVKKALKASFLSILAILLLIILAVLMDQGSTVIIHLLDNPWSLVGSIILINLLALASAHYPDYLDKYFSSNQNNPSGPVVKWKIHGLFGKNPTWGMGLITYSILPPQGPQGINTVAAQRQTGAAESDFLDHFRKITGLLVMMTWIYVLLFIMMKYEVMELPLFETSFVLLGLFIVFYFICYRARKYWGRKVANNMGKIEQRMIPSGKISPEESGIMKTDSRIGFYLHATLISFILLILAMAFTFWASCQAYWVYTWKALIVTSFINTIFIILFQHFRTVFSMASLPGYARWVPIYYLNNDITYVRFFAIMGILSLVTFVSGTFQPSNINALVFILLYIYLVYGFIVVLLKHHLLYREPVRNQTIVSSSPIAKIFFEKYVPILGVVLILWILYTGKAGNGLHVLHPLKEDEANIVTIDSFEERLHAVMEARPDSSVYFIASYGGGLRATTWTMLLLDTLQESNPDFFEETVAMSGVSGGFLGLSMYASILAEHHTPEDRKNIIDRIGKHNILSIDIAYLLGFDFIRELIPYVDSFYFKDRAGRSMQEYATLIQGDPDKRKKFLNTGYREYWSSLYNNPEKKFLPVLIGNSTATHSRYGLAYSLLSDSTSKTSRFNTIFPGGVDMLDLGLNTSISYLDATSTTERFPIFSPTAQINSKGHFLDGGYFENSGLLSLINFYEHLKDSTSLDIRDKTSKVIVIINSKEAYIRKVLGVNVIVKNELATGEMGAILRTVASTDILPLALEAKYKQQFGENFIPVYLPYPITFDEVVALIRGTPAFPLRIQERIDSSNQIIEKLLEPYKAKNKFPVPPALARVLSEPAYMYMKAMLNHQEVIDAIEKIN